MRFFVHRAAVLSIWLPLAAVISGCSQPAPAPAAAPAAPLAAPTVSPVERGRVLVQVGGCNDCHSPKKNGVIEENLRLSGHPSSIKITTPDKVTGPWVIGTNDMLTAWSGPWGLSFAANITPDPDTGLKASAWSEEAFLKAMKTGKHIGTGRDILLPMPWFMYKDLADEDLKAIWAYLMSIPPVKNEVPDPIAPAAGKK